MQNLIANERIARAKQIVMTFLGLEFEKIPLERPFHSQYLHLHFK